MNLSFWQGKRVFLTGHSGFKGGWLTLWLHKLGAEVTGVSLAPNTTPNLFTLANVENCCRSHFVDIRDVDCLKKIVWQARPEIVFHLAAQPLVRSSYRLPVETFATNVMGTVHVLDALRSLESVRVAVMVTTDKVYRNHEWHWPYREDDELGGHDPYSASKAASEIIIDSYRKSFLTERGISIASVRAGNVIGGGDWSEDRLIPDAMRAWKINQILNIRCPQAIRPWQHVLEPLAGYLTLAQKLWEQPALAGAYNFGPESGDVATVREVIELSRDAYGAGSVCFADSNEGFHEAGCLALEIAKARKVIGFKPRWKLRDAVIRTIAWYRAQEGIDASELCAADILAYEAGL